MTSAELTSLIGSLETARGTALVKEDWTALTSLLSPDLVHIHANGAVENLSHYLEGVQTRLAFEHVERESLDVRGSGNHAIATGVLKQTLQDRVSGKIFDIRVMTTQVWVQEEGVWRQASFHATHLPAP